MILWVVSCHIAAGLVREQTTCTASQLWSNHIPANPGVSHDSWQIRLFKILKVLSVSKALGVDHGIGPMRSQVQTANCSGIGLWSICSGWEKEFLYQEKQTHTQNHLFHLYCLHAYQINTDEWENTRIAGKIELENRICSECPKVTNAVEWLRASLPQALVSALERLAACSGAASHHPSDPVLAL